ncbi:Response regulators consisting of a CheY-like receiver domain and a winged-helix DNA-binding domain [Malonomonas rubra DSM 5091]|uniref:Response regulators consisting of a CheY-like receiver domain and a winged-helix DNA-binding domain n=1 Tax=Malonomonas rubra DSM 5091 TaxID=1122189 RepID=A0A1M6I0D0_MALRU|nr:response regulator [Malonomonas rubra]SHJ27972.1 Response regulators consisting of a CheY-like receiver domain and a winged-helix DNA-binding domain [Malonomonas rubra DSM 5091]
MPDISKKVMVIDDDRMLRSHLEKLLTAAGCSVETVDRGAIGLQKLLKDDFDLVLIDINMPEISGPAVCKALRKHEKTKDLKVVMITAMFHSPEQIEQAKADYGADEFLLKPFTSKDMLALLERLFNPDAQAENDASQGSLEEKNVPQLLHDLYSNEKTGLLHLERGDAKKIIYIKDGYPVFARSNVLNECLGRMLVKEGVLTQVDCDASVERSRESGRLQGTVLIEMGILTPQDLHAALSRQVTEKLLSTFKWGDGSFRFVDGKDFKKNVAAIKVSPASLIMQGIKNYWSQAQLDEFILPLRNLYLKQSGNPKYRFQDIELNRRGQEIYGQCLGSLTTSEIIDQHPLAKQEVQQVLAGLVLSELVEVSEVAEKVDAAEVPGISGSRPIDEQLRKKILEDYKRIMDTDYFEALGVSRQCNCSEVRRAYYKMAKEYHPDRFLGSGLSKEMSNKINEMFQYVSQAYTVLSDPKSCSDYLDELINGPKKSIDINQVIEAETAYQEGRNLLNIRRFSAAVKPLKRAIELSPEEPEYLTYFAWALFKSAPEKTENQTQAMEVLLASRELNPGLYQTHLYLGFVYQQQDKERQAEKCFEMAVQANPDCTEALRELRLINLRREQGAQSKGLLKKFIHKD